MSGPSGTPHGTIIALGDHCARVYTYGQPAVVISGHRSAIAAKTLIIPASFSLGAITRMEDYAALSGLSRANWIAWTSATTTRSCHSHAPVKAARSQII